ncbi:MAG: hypothetical protein LBS60_11375 [Deltaproteobacteria bacterium]|jgi:predicted esterase YcpF (UPF0227 family)|nr:hypothetical protein [Deltaproteobacteria bacterium]
MIINLHGFTGHGANSKYDWLKANLPNQPIFAPDLDYKKETPERIFGFLEEKVRSFLANPAISEVAILGSSLGAFFARSLNIVFPMITTVLINPALAPFITLRGLVDSRAYLALFARLTFLDDDLLAESLKLHLIIGDQDELINHEVLTKPLLPPNLTNIHVIKGGTHRLRLTPEVGAILKDRLPKVA